MRLSLLLTIGAALLVACGVVANSPAGNSNAEVPAVTDTSNSVERESASVSRTNDRKDENMSEYTLKPVTMTATAKNTNAGLLIEYTVENHTDQIQYLWDLMIKYEGNDQKIDHDGAYVFFVAPKTLNVIRAELPLPKAFDIARKEIPFARILPAGGKLNGKVRLPHPVTETSPYYPPPKEDQQEKSVASEVVLMVAWTSVKPGMNITERTVGGEKVFAIRGSWASPYQEILQEKFSVPVDVITYKDDFERQTPLR
ncbi:MAG: hypothetical protein IT174_07290 [Acidobacteria bacterium]|nr:hypothetical protein [Acidobacteriota bacterium]